MNIHAHQDDFEFTAAGTFARVRSDYPESFEGHVTVCTDGAAGHHLRSREETSRIRFEEQKQALDMAGLHFEALKYPDGTSPAEGCMVVGPQLLAALWHSIRAFKPNFIFCPPLPVDNRVGVHVDHVVIAEAVRRVAYLINVPQAYLDFYLDERPPFEPVATPVIFNTMDSYMGLKDAFDLVVDISDAFEQIARMSWCHQSQITEWLPWVGRHHFKVPENFEAWKSFLLERMEARQKRLGLPTGSLYEFFSVSGWGEVVPLNQILEDLPCIDKNLSHLDGLEKKLDEWSSQGT